MNDTIIPATRAFVAATGVLTNAQLLEAARRIRALNGDDIERQFFDAVAQGMEAQAERRRRDEEAAT